MNAENDYSAETEAQLSAENDLGTPAATSAQSPLKTVALTQLITEWEQQR